MHQDADAAIIKLLIEDTRVTIKRMAQITGLPESTVRARLGRIIRNGRVAPSILVHPDVEAERFLFIVRIEPADGATAEELLAEPAFAASPWCAKSSTSDALFVQFAATTMNEMLDFIEHVRGTRMVDLVTYSVVSRLYVGESWRAKGAGEAVWASAPTRSVDETDSLLIDALRQDGRASYTELAGVSGLTVAATRRRVLRLVEDGVIRFATRTDAGVLTEQEASVDVAVRAGDVPAFIASTSTSPSVRYIIEQSGDYNLACYAVAADTLTLVAAVSAITSDPRVRRSHVDPFLVLRDRLSWTEQ